MVRRRRGRCYHRGDVVQIWHERIAQRHVGYLSCLWHGSADCNSRFHVQTTSDTMNALLTPDQLEALRRFTTPTISNALERLGLPHSLDNQTDGSIRCMYPELGAM